MRFSGFLGVLEKPRFTRNWCKTAPRVFSRFFGDFWRFFLGCKICYFWLKSWSASYGLNAGTH